MILKCLKKFIAMKKRKKNTSPVKAITNYKFENFVFNFLKLYYTLKILIRLKCIMILNMYFLFFFLFFLLFESIIYCIQNKYMVFCGIMSNVYFSKSSQVIKVYGSLKYLIKNSSMVLFL